MSDYDPAETNDGDVTSWKPLTTIWPSSSGFGSSFGLDGPSLVASDPGCGLEIDSAVKCQPAAGTTWWEQGRLGKGVYSGYTAVRILPLTCPESFSTVVTSIKDQCCRVGCYLANGRTGQVLGDCLSDVLPGTILTYKTQSETSGNQRRKHQPKPDSHRSKVRPKPPSSLLPSPSLARKALVAGVVALAVGLILWLKGSQTELGHYTSRAVDWDDRREQVKEAFISSWDAYSEHAWGQDQFHPLSKKGSQMSPDGLGWIIVDSLDTLMIMNLTSRLSDARKWLHRKLSYNQDQDANTFETTIRLLGGLLSAHYLASQLPDASSQRDHVYLSKAVDLADRLLGAYESRSGIPYASVNLRTVIGISSHTDGGASSTAEAGTVQMEMKYLAHLTGKEIYWRKAEEVMKVLDDNRMEGGLLPIYVDPETGRFMSREIRLGSRGDSYYEYLIKQYLQTSGQEPIYLEMWSDALAGIQKHLVTSTKFSNLKFVAELPSGIGGRLSPKMDHLVCFLPGCIALGATGGLTETEARRAPGWGAEQDQQMQLSRELMKTCWGMYKVTETGLAPEIAWFHADDAALQPAPRALPRSPSKNSKAAWKKDYIVKPLDAHNLQRPETVESLFMMWRITNDPIYREWGWEIFNAFRKYTILDDGGLPLSR